MKKNILFAILLVSFSLLFAQDPFVFSTSNDGIFRDGKPFFIYGQSWAKKTDFTYEKGSAAELKVKEKLTELNEIGINLIRIYGSPDESDWSGSSNYANLIKWIEEWNITHPDQGDPNKAMYYMVQISPKDPLSSISGDLPENTSESINRAVNDLSNPGSVARLIQTIDNSSTGGLFLLGYLIYHEFNVSSKYSAWMQSIGANGIENFMNVVADSIHHNYAQGKLVSHTGDAKDPETDIYKSIEALDQSTGNVLENFDLLGFNLYISNHSLLDQNSYYKRIVDRRSLSVNANRGWYVGETGASYDKDADPASVALANYTNPQGAANLQIMWHKSKALGNMLGFMLFTVQDNDLRELVNFNAMKQRGYYDYFGEKKFLYYIYPDIVTEISTNSRSHTTDDYGLKISVIDDGINYVFRFQFINNFIVERQFALSIFGDDVGASNQRFSRELHKEYVSILPGDEKEILKTIAKPTMNKLIAVEASLIKEMSPVNQYFWGREHLLEDAVSTIAGLNLNTDNLPDEPLITSTTTILYEERDLIRGLYFMKNNPSLSTPEGIWELDLYNLNGMLLFKQKLSSFEAIDIDKCLPHFNQSLAIYTLRRL